MKKTICILISLVMILSAFTITANASNDISITSDWKILTVENPTVQQEFAVTRLQEVIKDSTGFELPAVTNAGGGNYIAIDSALAYNAGEEPPAENGYIIRAKDGNIYISGTGIRGTIQGVYRFLAEFLGYRVYTKTIIMVDEMSSILVPADTDISYTPFFEYTCTDWESPRYIEYAVANGITGGPYVNIPDSMGGTVNYLGRVCHTLTESICSRDTYFGTHPEYFAYRNGKRVDKQLCLTNSDVVDLVKNEVLELLATGHNPDASLQIISLTQADNQEYCTCENCVAFEKAHGNVRSATMINFVNQVADVVKEAGYDNVVIDTFAYQYTRKAPTGIVPRDNVCVRLCPIECCFAHTLDDKNCASNVAFMKDLVDWKNICNRLYIWDYTNNFSHTCTVFPNFGVLQRNVQVFVENNVKGVYESGNYYMYACDSEFGELRAYLLSKLMQNPYLDYDKTMDEFLAAYYGKGWMNIRKAIDMYTDKAGDVLGHLRISYLPKDSLQLSNRQVKIIDRYWEAAYNEAETDMHRENIYRSELSWRYYKADTGKGEFSSLNSARFDEMQKLYDDLITHGVTTLNERHLHDILDCPVARYVKPNQWYQFEEGTAATQAKITWGQAQENSPLNSIRDLLYRIMNWIWGMFI
ncbi:MAG TPA: DUF4838 domain-containing protein [Clostridiales bacterium]|nr:DUF4838 domain-containing protein [Clostridiales bacterium]